MRVQPLPTEVLSVGFAPGGASDWPLLLAAIFELLPRLIGCDEIVWNGVDPRKGRVTVYSSDSGRYDAASQRLLLELEDHPIKNHFLTPADSASGPIRISDISGDREFRNTRTWVELFRPNGVTRQLTIPTGFNSDVTAGTAWSFNRNGSDFSDDDVATALALQPVLAAVEASQMWKPDPEDALRFGTSRPWAERPEGSSKSASVADQPPLHPPNPLTRREAEVLSLVAQGLTAVSIGYRLRISSATVRKHLEHTYAKLGQRDRLLAVTYAQQLGILPDQRSGSAIAARTTIKSA